MSLPIAISVAVVRHLIQKRLQTGHNGRGPIVLMLELTHACNLRCDGCGRIREYAGTSAQRLSREQARSIVEEANTPVVSISGGEPLLLPDIAAIAQDVLDMGKVVYMCTNGTLMGKRLYEFTPHPRFFFNVHVDGPPAIHDALTKAPGTTGRALEAIRNARAAGFGITTNTTIYYDTPTEQVAALFGQLTEMGVNGLTVAPAFAYEVGAPARTLTRDEAHVRFQELERLWGSKNLYHTPLFMQFLRGERELPCMPWGVVTYNPQGWKRPCYLLTDAHLPSLEQLLVATDWDAYGPGRDPRCANCLMHSGFETSVMGNMHTPGDLWQIVRWELFGA